MKSVGIQYLETIRRYINEKLTFDRTIHVSFMPGNSILRLTRWFISYNLYYTNCIIPHGLCILDEEIGGILGMAHFVKTNEFRSLNVGFTLDEGLASTDDVIPLFYGERTILRQYMVLLIIVFLLFCLKFVFTH